MALASCRRGGLYPRESRNDARATREGQTNPAGVDGLIASSVFPKPVLPLTVTIGGVNAQIAYFGAAPQLTAGVLQLNVVVPSTVPVGPNSLVVTVGGVSSRADVTLAVK